MKKYELGCEKSDVILKIIKNIILSRYPIIDDRMDKLFVSPSPAIDIIINFYQNKNNEQFTQIMFCNGNENSKCSIPEEIIINGLISYQTIVNIINFILNDHDYVKDMYKIGNRYIFSFGVNLNNNNIHGISCGTIGLHLENCSIEEDIITDYLKVIISNFYDKLNHTDFIKREFNNYFLAMKRNVLDSLSDDELRLFISLLNNDDLCNILLNISNGKFMELYEKFNDIKNSNDKCLIKK